MSKKTQINKQSHYSSRKIFINGTIHTLDKQNSIAEALVVDDNNIIYIGSNKGAKKFITTHSQIYNLDRKVVIPGLIDSHTHPPGTSLTELYEVSLFNLNSVDAYVEAVKNFIVKNPNIDCIYGSGWLLSSFNGEELVKGPKKERLDEISSSIPIVLKSCDGHTLWLNSAALSKFNITSETDEPNGGIIEKNKNGQLWGTLKENAVLLIPPQSYTNEQYLNGFKAFQDKMHSFGVTGILSMAGYNCTFNPKLYKQLEDSKQLKLRVGATVLIDGDEDLNPQLENLNQLRNTYNSDYFNIVSAKILADGTIEGLSANLKQPFSSDSTNYGDFLWDTEKLNKAVLEINKLDMSIHVHSIGDKSTERVLDAIEYSQKTLGTNTFRNTITHLQLVSENDIERMANLDVIAAVQPFWHFKIPGWWESVDCELLGERAYTQYPLNSFISKNIVTCSSSDHCVTVNPNPFYGIQTGVTRSIHDLNSFGLDIADREKYILNINEAASVLDMVKSFTINGAYTMFSEKSIGTLEVNKKADFIALNQDIFTCNKYDIENTEVLMTVFDGEIVYTKNQCEVDRDFSKII